MLCAKPLPRVPHLKPVVSAWLLSEWPGWYAEGGAGDLLGDVDAFAASELELPVGIVVFDDDEPVGFGALKQVSISTHTHLAPWAAAGYVVPARRGRGVGAFLLRAIVAHAKAIGYDSVYCGTSTAIALMKRAGWQQIERITYAGKPLVIFRSGA
jgi:GNAT superfamily N-acetyltransferase